MADASAFFRYARRRHEIFLRRQRGDPPPWTDDPILRQYRFTNIFREDDRTTIWCREHVRDRYDGEAAVLPAVVVFRWFNKIETGEAIFLRDRPSAFEQWVAGKWDITELARIIRAYRGEGPYVNGAYIIKSPPGMSKLDGVLQSCERFRTKPCMNMRWDYFARRMTETGRETLEAVWDWLRGFDQLGDFMAYEIVTDLRHTHLLRDAPDIMTWANAGPGAVRGLNRLHGRPVGQSLPKAQSLAEMQDLLKMSRSPLRWPQEWGRWEMREVEHTLCEHDKYVRVTTGEGRPKQLYRGGGSNEV